MIVFTVCFQNEVERALARLFLQQFAGEQKHVPQSPHCDYRRPSDPPKELLDLGEDFNYYGDELFFT